MIKRDGKFLLLKKKSLNNRTLLAWYNMEDDIFSIALFNQVDRPNKLSAKASFTEWGYPTYFISDILDVNEAHNVSKLYLEDIASKNFWWEKD